MTKRSIGYTFALLAVCALLSPGVPIVISWAHSSGAPKMWNVIPLSTAALSFVWLIALECHPVLVSVIPARMARATRRLLWTRQKLWSAKWQAERDYKSSNAETESFQRSEPTKPPRRTSSLPARRGRQMANAELAPHFTLFLANGRRIECSRSLSPRSWRG